MPQELRDIAKAVAKYPKPEQAEIRKQLKRQAAEWRAEHCWHPNQLRHNFATDARREFGIEPTRGALGHNNLRTSELYAEKDLQMAHQIVARIG